MITKSRSEIQRLFRISDKTVDNYVSRGIFKRVGKSKYDFESCISGYVDMINSRNDKGPTLKDREMRKLELEIEKREMENDEKRESLIDRQDRDRELYELQRMTRDAVLKSIPEITPKIAKETNQKKIEIILETEIKKALTKLADKLLRVN